MRGAVADAKEPAQVRSGRKYRQEGAGTLGRPQDGRNPSEPIFLWVPRADGVGLARAARAGREE